MTSGDLDESFTSLSRDLRREMREHESLRAAKQKEERDALRTRGREHDELLRQFLTSQVQATENSDATAKWRAKYVWAPIVSLVMGGGGFVGFHSYSAQPATGAPTVSNDVTTRLDRVGNLERQLKLQRLLIVRLAQIVSDQGVQLSDSVFFLGQKLDRINGRSKRVKPPMSVDDATTAAMQIKETRTPFTGYDPADPLGDLLRRNHGSK